MINIAVPKNDRIYKLNMEALKNRYPQYYDVINNIDDSQMYQPIFSGKLQQLNVFNKIREAFYYDVEKPIEKVGEYIDNLHIRNAKIPIILGLGLGYEAEYFVEKYSSLHRSQAIILVEKDLALFKTALRFTDFTPMFANNRMLIVLGEQPENLFTVFEKFLREEPTLVHFIKAYKAVYYKTSIDWYESYYNEVLKTLGEATKYILEFYGNDPHDSLIGVANMLDNMETIIHNPGINLLYNQFKSKPAIIVSTGPSLNKNKHLLKGLEDKAVFICPDASLRILLDMGVKPHMVTALERVPETVTLIKGFTEEEVKDIYYAACPVIVKEAYDAYKGPNIIVYRNFNHFKWIDIDRGILDIKQSSGNMAFKIAEALGCNPIILVGQDLAYSRDGKSHAAGSIFGENQIKDGVETFEVMGNDGEMIQTNATWNTFRQSYEVDVAASGRTVINATEGGALIKGTQLMPLSEAIEKFIPEVIDPLTHIKKCLSQFDAKLQSEDENRFKIILKNTYEDLLYMKSECEAGIAKIKENKEILKSESLVDTEIIKENATPIIMHRLNILKKQPTMSLFLMHIVQSYNIKFEVEMNALFDNYDNDDIGMKEVAFSFMISVSTKEFNL